MCLTSISSEDPKLLVDSDVNLLIPLTLNTCMCAVFMSGSAQVPSVVSLKQTSANHTRVLVAVKVSKCLMLNHKV